MRREKWVISQEELLSWLRSWTSGCSWENRQVWIICERCTAVSIHRAPEEVMLVLLRLSSEFVCTQNQPTVCLKVLFYITNKHHFCSHSPWFFSPTSDSKTFLSYHYLILFNKWNQYNEPTMKYIMNEKTQKESNTENTLTSTATFSVEFIFQYTS